MMVGNLESCFYQVVGNCNQVKTHNEIIGRISLYRFPIPGEKQARQKQSDYYVVLI